METGRKPMAKKKTDDTWWIGVLFIVAFLAIPFLIVAGVEYFRLKRRYLDRGETIRIVDLWRAFQRAGYGLAAAMAVAAAAYLLLGMKQDAASQLFLTAGLVALAALGLAIAVLTGRAFAIGLLGVILDRRTGTLVFPSDGILRSFSDPLVVVNSIIPFMVESLPVKEIKGMTRQAGRTLLLHGDFGSRAITFSDKLRRDQLLGLLSNNRKFVDFESASAGDYA